MHFLNLKYDADVKEWLSKIHYLTGTPRRHIILNMIKYFRKMEDQLVAGLLKNLDK